MVVGCNKDLKALHGGCPAGTDVSTTMKTVLSQEHLCISNLIIAWRASWTPFIRTAVVFA